MDAGCTFDVRWSVDRYVILSAAQYRASAVPVLMSVHPVPRSVREYGFELRLAAHLERDGLPGLADVEDGGLLGRQLGTSVAGAGSRVMDLVYVEPGPDFDIRRRLSGRTIPPVAIESDVGVGRFQPLASAIDAPPEIARRIGEAAAEAGFFELARRSGSVVARQTTRYPDWFGRLVGIENKPDLGSPGDLAAQLRQDRSLRVLDAVILATETYVTRAHLNRLPDAIGVWRVDFDAPDPIEVIREPSRLRTDGAGFEVVDAGPGRVDVEPVSQADKARQRRRIAERAYGKGWRTFELPACATADPTAVAGTTGLPGCSWKGRLVDPAAECGPSCSGHEPAAAPVPERGPEAERERRTPWVADPPGVARRQVDLDHFRSE